MELPTDTLPTTSTELEQLGKEQTLGEAKYLGCPRIETSNALPTTTSRGATTTPRGTVTVPTFFHRVHGLDYGRI